MPDNDNSHLDRVTLVGTDGAKVTDFPVQRGKDKPDVIIYQREGRPSRCFRTQNATTYIECKAIWVTTVATNG